MNYISALTILWGNGKRLSQKAESTTKQHGEKSKVWPLGWWKPGIALREYDWIQSSRIQEFLFLKAREGLFPPPLIRPDGHLLPREKIFLRFLKKWILQLRASPACRMTWRWVERLEHESSSVHFAATNFIKWTAYVLCQRNGSIKKQWASIHNRCT